MTNKTLITILHIIAAVGAVVGGASSIPGLGLPPQVLAYGLLIAAVATAIAGQLVQVKGESDETQGIAPAQVALAQAAHDQAKIPPSLTSAPATTTVKALAFGLLLSVGLLSGCKSNPVADASASNQTFIATVDIAMQNWATYTQTHPVSLAKVQAVSNAYNVYWNSELVLSNLSTIYVANPSTNTAALVNNAIATVFTSATNITAIVNTLTK
jgi:hypothetical protein